METHDVLIVGGGPAGSSAAWSLKRAGVDVLVLDKDSFPRLKLCAGWITPELVRDLEIDPATYPHRFLTFDRIHVHVKGIHIPLRAVQHSIRRFEFDAWLLERSGAPVVQHEARAIRSDGDAYVVDDAFRGKYLIGAGGTNCPVYRTFFRDLHPRPPALRVVALEHELAYDWKDPGCHLWFFDGGLRGYSWYVPKADGWLNVGVGGMAAHVKRSGRDIKEHWARLATRLDRGLAPGATYDPGGHSYYVRGRVQVPRVGNAFIAGDSAGLATHDMCEGIGPAARSGLRAARSIVEGVPYDISDVTGASLGGGLPTRALDWVFTRGA